MKILIADDDRSLRRVLQFKLEKNGYEVEAVENGQQALEKLEKMQFDLLLSDIKMPKIGGIELLEHSRTLQPDLKVILITAHATVSQAVKAVKMGAFDYITKPFEDEELLVAIEKALAFKKLERENRQLKNRLKRSERAPRLIGISKPFRDMLAMIDKIAATDATVLLNGESGTGKELIARTLHDKSSRAEGEFVPVNCAAIPRDLLESELFGHVKGAFTGAVKDKKGKFELADGGTLFLDEVGELAFDLQAKLLRALQEKVVEPVGAETARRIDARVIGATNINLQERVADGRFRDDLYYRLNVIPIMIPSLAERKDDIPLLVRGFVHRFEPDGSIEISSELLNLLAGHSWPGNIRELENMIERMLVLRKTNTLTNRDLPGDFGIFSRQRVTDTDDTTGDRLTFQKAEENLVRDALQKCGWNRTRAARYLSIPRHVLIYRIKKYGIKESDAG